MGKIPPCIKCGSALVPQKARRGHRYFSCSNSQCRSEDGRRTFIAHTLGVPCPLCGAKLNERSGGKLGVFTGCEKYPACNFVIWGEAVEEPCPDCGFPLLVRKFSTRKGHIFKCANRAVKCRYWRKATPLPDINLDGTYPAPPPIPKPLTYLAAEFS